MNVIILALGSNRNRRKNIRQAQQFLRNLLPDIIFTKTIKTDAIGSNTPLPFFYNCMAKATTSLPLAEVQQQLRNIETTMGDSHESHQKGIVVIDIDEKKQLERLMARDKQKAIYLQEINKTNKIDENKNKATYLINNSSDLSSFKDEIKRIFKDLKDLK